MLSEQCVTVSNVSLLASSAFTLQELRELGLNALPRLRRAARRFYLANGATTRRARRKSRRLAGPSGSIATRLNTLADAGMLALNEIPRETVDCPLG